MSLLLLFGQIPTISGSKYVLNNVVLPKPTLFKREFLFFKKDMRAISGKLGRDISSKKEKFTLKWDYLKKIEYDNILEIIELNTAVPFEAVGGNVLVNETDVIPYVKQATYTTPGTSFLASLEVELVEES